MRRRWIIRSLFLVPILLCMIGWAWSATHTLAFSHTHGNDVTYFGMRWGEIVLDFTTSPYHGGDGWANESHPVDFRVIAPHFFDTSSRFLGFACGHETKSFKKRSPDEWRYVGVPLWFLIVIFSAAWLLVWRKTRAKPNPKAAFPVEVGEGGKGKAVDP